MASIFFRYGTYCVRKVYSMTKKELAGELRISINTIAKRIEFL